MHKPSPSRTGFIAAVAAAAGLSNIIGMSPAQVLNRYRGGKAPEGKKYKSSSVYWPAGDWFNCNMTRVKNPKQAAQITAMHEKWLAARAERLPDAMLKEREK
jgi:hypothetical protein